MNRRLRNKLVDALFELESTRTFLGRTDLFSFIPISLPRSETDRMDDLETVVNCLIGLGSLNSGENLIVLLAEKGYEQSSELFCEILQEIKEVYK